MLYEVTLPKKWTSRHEMKVCHESILFIMIYMASTIDMRPSYYPVKQKGYVVRWSLIISFRGSANSWVIKFYVFICQLDESSPTKKRLQSIESAAEDLLIATAGSARAMEALLQEKHTNSVIILLGTMGHDCRRIVSTIKEATIFQNRTEMVL